MSNDSSKAIDLIGEGIENPFNAKAMIDIAHMFKGNCLFRDRKNLAELPDFSAGNALDEADVIGARGVSTIGGTTERVSAFRCIDLEGIRGYSPVVALENLHNAHDLYGFKPPPGALIALIAGNEKSGIAHDVRTLATHFVQIPMPGSKVNTLNVAAASGVALYYLSKLLGGKMQVKSHLEKRRPELLFVGPGDHVELGSAIRSAGAFGWNRLFIEDRHSIWFGCDRAQRAEGRAAARRHRNTIRLVPAKSTAKYAFKQVTVVSSIRGNPLHQAKLNGGPQQLLVVPDESAVSLDSEDWSRLGSDVQFVRIELPASSYVYYYRLFASIALAECARQVGQSAAARAVKAARQEPLYESSLASLFEDVGEEILLADLQKY